MKRTKEQILKLVKDLTEEFKLEGWNKSQAKSLAWAEYYESYSIAYLVQGLACSYRFECSCLDCNEHRSFGAADSIRLFMIEHKDHKTSSRKV